MGIGFRSRPASLANRCVACTEDGDCLLGVSRFQRFIVRRRDFSRLLIELQLAQRVDSGCRLHCGDTGGAPDSRRLGAKKWIENTEQRCNRQRSSEKKCDHASR